MNTTLFLDVNDFALHTTFLHGFARVFTDLGAALFLPALVAAWWGARRAFDAPRAVAAALWAALGTLVALAVNQPVGRAIGEKRPYDVLHHVQVLVARSHDVALPSDHAVAVGAASAGLFLVGRYAGRAARRLAAAGALVALAVGFSRVYVGVHYPGDVAAGLGLGAVVSVLGWWAVGARLTRVAAGLGRSRLLRPLVYAPARRAG